MKLIRWAHYCWNLAAFAPECPALPPSYTIRFATPEDGDSVRAVVMSSFTLDSDWNSMFGEVRPLIEAALHSVFHEKPEPFCLVVAHGARIIGASGLASEPEAENHLLTGPCISMEYRNRGLGKALLAESLLRLKKAGVATARGSTKQGAAPSRILYSKFGSSLVG